MGHMQVTNNILQRTFCIRCDQSQGTCFTIEVEGRQYLVTARHVVTSIVGPGTVQILHDNSWKSLQVDLVGHGSGTVDVAVLAPSMQLSAPYSLLVEGASVKIGQDVRFLGFPYGMGSEMGDLNRDFPIPLVKQGIMSGVESGEGNNFWLDGHNNPGFSGGPVVCQNDQGNKLAVIGIISGYRNELKSIYHGESKTPFQYYDNTGIVVAVPIRHALDLIRQNPIGFSIASEGE